MVCAPGARAGKGKLQPPSGPTVAWPISVSPSKMRRTSPGPPVPARSPRLPAVNCAPGAGLVMVGVTTVGAGVGAALMLIGRGCELASTLPLASSARANRVCWPGVRAGMGKRHLPPSSAATLPICRSPSNRPIACRTRAVPAASPSAFSTNCALGVGAVKTGASGVRSMRIVNRRKRRARRIAASSCQRSKCGVQYQPRWRNIGHSSPSLACACRIQPA